MSLVLSVADGLNIAWGLVADESAESVRDKARDIGFKRRVRVQVENKLATDQRINRRRLRKALGDDAFVSWVIDPLELDADDHIEQTLTNILTVDNPGTRAALARALVAGFIDSAFEDAPPALQVIMKYQMAADDRLRALETIVQNTQMLLTAPSDSRSRI